MKKFILIDNLLDGIGGHCYEYAVQVLESAKRSGYTAILAAHKKFPYTEEVFEVRRLYPLKEEYFLKNWIFRKVAQTPIFTLLEVFRKKKPPFFARFDETQKKSPLRLSLRILPKIFLFGLNRVDVRIRIFFFIRQTKALLDQVQPTHEDIFFVPNATLGVLNSLYQVFQRQGEPKGTWHILLRWDFVQDSSEFRKLRKYIKMIAYKIGKSRVFFYTDTQELTHQYKNKTGFLFETLPIPIRVQNLVDLQKDKESQKRSKDSRGFRIVFLGEARDEKGFGLLQEIISNLLEHFSEEEIFITVQSYSLASVVSDSIKSTMRFFKERVRGQRRNFLLKESPLSTIEYQNLILESDLILLPYCPSKYSHRSSGALIDALAYGKPVLVRDRSWLSEELKRQLSQIPSTELGNWGPADFSFDSDCLEEFINKVKRIILYSQEVKAIFSRIGAQVRSINDPDSLVERLKTNAKNRGVFNS